MNYIADFLKRNVQTMIRSRGAWLYNYGDNVRLDRLDRHSGTARYIVRSESGRGAYTVSLMNYDKLNLRVACTCPYDGVCKHAVAAMMHLENHLRFNPRDYNPADERFPLQQFDVHFFIANTQVDRLEAGIKLYKKQRVHQKAITTESATYSVQDDTNLQEVVFQLAPKEMITQCTCDDTGSALCSHKVAALTHFVTVFGETPFASLGDFTDAKKAKLAEYGYSIDDKDIDKLFDFVVRNGEFIVTPKDASIVKLNQYQHWNKITDKLVKPSVPILQENGVSEGRPAVIYVFSFNVKEKKSPLFNNPIRLIKSNSEPFNDLVSILNPKDKKSTAFPGFKMTPVKATIKNEKIVGRLAAIDTDERNFKLKDIEAFDSTDATLIKTAAAIDQEHIDKTLERFLSPSAQTSYQLTWEDLSKSSDFEIAVDFIGETLRDIIKSLEHKYSYEYLGDDFDTIKVKNISPVTFSRFPAFVEFELNEKEDTYIFKTFITVDNQRFELDYLQRVNYWLLRELSTIYLLDKKSAYTLYTLDYRSQIVIKKTELEGFLNQFVLPIMNVHNVSFNIPVQLNDVEGIFSPKLYLKEQEDTLIFTPAFSYEYSGNKREIEFDNHTRQVVTEDKDGEIYLMYREEEKEEKYRAFLNNLHPNFASQSAYNPAFYSLTINQLFENEWFFSAFEKLNQNEIEVLGFAELTKIKYNPNRAKINIKASSGMDWFDLEISVSFGNQNVSLKEVRKAVMNNQHYVRLGDGTLGILPQEWLEKYASVLKIGKLDGEKIRMNDRQFSLVEDLYEEIDNHEALRNLYEKKQRLRQFENIKEVILPTNIKADLRDYQKAGFNWLNFLDEYGWGGILADDMGLGKTLQAITFLQYIVNKHPEATNLVVVPKSLVFNWIKEIEKFAPELNVLVYYGTLRHQHKFDLEKYQVIIATYGSVRSDIVELREVAFNYVILDESQAVKNPDALVSKSVKLLKAKNRICMSGTPIENNTFDLYSQLDFLNPGMLGSVDFFKREYATPIDKDKSEIAVSNLRRLVYPFILRRTKEEVAKELPEKVETTIYCEMGTHQRKVYDYFKDKYRDYIMGKIESEGLNNAGMYILEGLMKLRQICNSPALLNEKEDYGKESIKLEEIIPRISEDSGRHKILVFSQFLDMLDLIRKELDKLHIKYEYLDGQTKDRIERVENFQNNEECRVFLMSLKAGGVGLNLTAADYVYLVDPWWNPAVEAQAIDRAHRIGQEKSVFAYKLICKDTIEEKILQLQERKKAVAKDLINVESGFIKALDKEDVRDLFM